MIDNTKKIDLIRQGLNQNTKPSANNPARKAFHQMLNEEIVQSSGIPIKEVVLDHSHISPQRCIAKTSESDYERIMNIVFKHEGKSLVKNDGGSGESSKFGILESTARQYGYKGDMGHMTKRDAEAIYKKLWDKSGAANLPYPLSLVHFDTFVNSPSAARRILERSQGDVDTYLSLRQERYKRLAELRPERFARYAKGWNNRINNLRAMVEEERTASSLAANPLGPNSVIASLSPLKGNPLL